MSASLAEAIRELTLALPGVNATKYLSAAGLVVLLYDHLLLLELEISHIWAAQWTWSKGLWIINRYVVPACLMINAHVLSGLSTAGLSTSVIVSPTILGEQTEKEQSSYVIVSCKAWLPISAFIGITSLAIANLFIVQRVWALCGRNTTVLKVLATIFTIVYIITYVASAVGFARLVPHLEYSPFVKTCVLSEKPRIFIVMYAVPIAMDVLIFALTCWNAFDRPRHMQTAITRQLVADGVVYFISLMSLRLFNIIIIAKADLPYSQLGIYFLWAMVTVLINRMLILSGTVEVYAGPDPSGRETPFHIPGRSSYDDDDDEEDLYALPSFIELDEKPHKAQLV